MKGETRSRRNRQSSLDSMPESDDDTRPLLQQSAQSSGSTLSTSTTTSHGTFRRDGVTSGDDAEAGAATDDENSKYKPQSKFNILH